MYFSFCQGRDHWTQWSTRSHCDVTCGSGTRTATRPCQGYGSFLGSSSRSTICYHPHHCTGIQTSYLCLGIIVRNCEKGRITNGKIGPVNRV